MRRGSRRLSPPATVWPTSTATMPAVRPGSLPSPSRTSVVSSGRPTTNSTAKGPRRLSSGSVTGAIDRSVSAATSTTSSLASPASGFRIARPAPWAGHFNLTLRAYQEMEVRLKKQGLRPEQVTGYADGSGSPRFAALFVQADTPWEARLDLTPNSSANSPTSRSPAGCGRRASAPIRQVPVFASPPCSSRMPRSGRCSTV